MFYMLLLFCTLPFWGAVHTVVLKNHPFTKATKQLVLQEHFAVSFAENYTKIECDNKRINIALKETDLNENAVTVGDTIKLGFQPSLLVWVL